MSILSNIVEDLTVLRALATRYPTSVLALSEIAVLEAELQLPKPVVHVLSDIHGEYEKLRHVINNASGSVRLLVASLFGESLRADAQRELLAVIYYPREAMDSLRNKFLGTAEREQWTRRMLRLQFAIIRRLTRLYRREHYTRIFPIEHRELFEELLAEPCMERAPAYADSMIAALARHDQDLQAVRAASRVIRNLSVAETVVAGDVGDRGPRIDRVLDLLMQQPAVSFVWGNHDASWMGACLGQKALIATVVRLSVRYRRFLQLEEGYGITLAPLEELARTIYKDDPAIHFKVKTSPAVTHRSRGSEARATEGESELLAARMQKAIAIIQFKLEGETSRRHPDWGMEGRNLLHRIDTSAGTIEIAGRKYGLRDWHLPTVDAADPYRLSLEEQRCIKSLRQSFVTSNKLWNQMSFMARHGSMWTQRDRALIFHACVPVDETGEPLTLEIKGVRYAGRKLLDYFDFVVRRLMRGGVERAGVDVDWLWYLWAGARSPLFGKDRMTTFEQYFVADSEAHVEHKNPYFEFIHDADFCRGIAAEFGVADALIVNGHVPVRVEAGENPVKRSGTAVTIDGAFSAAYGDRGYTLILDAERIALAEHHSFASVAAAINDGSDIVPRVTTIRDYDQPRRVSDTEQGDIIRHKIAALERLITAYEEGVLIERPPA